LDGAQPQTFTLYSTTPRQSKAMRLIDFVSKCYACEVPLDRVTDFASSMSRDGEVVVSADFGCDKAYTGRPDVAYIAYATSATAAMWKMFPRPGLGDMVAAGLASVGVTKERVSAVVGRPCRCPERQAALNAAGAKWLGLPPGSTVSTDIDPPA